MRCEVKGDGERMAGGGAEGIKTKRALSIIPEVD